MIERERESVCVTEREKESERENQIERDSFCSQPSLKLSETATGCEVSETPTSENARSFARDTATVSPLPILTERERERARESKREREREGGREGGKEGGGEGWRERERAADASVLALSSLLAATQIWSRESNV